MLGAIALLGVVVETPGAGASAAACGDSGWPAVAEGQPAAPVSSRLAGVFVWHDGSGWHVRTRGSAGEKLPFRGLVVASSRRAAPAALVRLTSTIGDTSSGETRLASDAISFSFTSGDSADGFDFMASCADSLAFTLSAPRVAPASAPGAVGSKGVRRSPLPPPPVLFPPVFLGGTGRAPALSFRLTRPPSTGVEGQVVVGPTCPVEPVKPPASAPNPCAAKPVRATVVVEALARGKVEPGKPLATVATDAGGRFHVDLPAGGYLLVPKARVGFSAKSEVVDVSAGVVTQVVLSIDSGIR